VQAPEPAIQLQRKSSFLNESEKNGNHRPGHERIANKKLTVSPFAGRTPRREEKGITSRGGKKPRLVTGGRIASAWGGEKKSEGKMARKLFSGAPRGGHYEGEENREGGKNMGEVLLWKKTGLILSSAGQNRKSLKMELDYAEKKEEKYQKEDSFDVTIGFNNANAKEQGTAERNSLKVEKRRQLEKGKEKIRRGHRTY